MAMPIAEAYTKAKVKYGRTVAVKRCLDGTCKIVYFTPPKYEVREDGVLHVYGEVVLGQGKTFEDAFKDARFKQYQDPKHLENAIKQSAGLAL